MNTCPYIKKNQLPCRIRLRNGFEYCGSHSKTTVVKARQSQSKQVQQSQPVQPIKPVKKPAPKPDKKTLHSIIDDELNKNFNNKDNDEDPYDASEEERPETPPPKQIKNSPIKHSPLKRTERVSRPLNIPQFSLPDSPDRLMSMFEESNDVIKKRKILNKLYDLAYLTESQYTELFQDI